MTRVDRAATAPRLRQDGPRRPDRPLRRGRRAFASRGFVPAPSRGCRSCRRSPIASGCQAEPVRSWLLPLLALVLAAAWFVAPDCPARGGRDPSPRRPGLAPAARELRGRRAAVHRRIPRPRAGARSSRSSTPPSGRASRRSSTCPTRPRTSPTSSTWPRPARCRTRRAATASRTKRPRVHGPAPLQRRGRVPRRAVRSPRSSSSRASTPSNGTARTPPSGGGIIETVGTAAALLRARVGDLPRLAVEGPHSSACS